MSRTLGDILKETAYLTESVAGPGQWTPAAYAEAINWACFEAGTRARMTWALRRLAGVIDSNLLALANAVPEILAVRDVAMGKLLLKSTEADENMLDPSWAYTTGTPTAWFPRSGNTVVLNRKLAAGANFDVEVVEAPAMLAAAGDLIDSRLPDHAVYALRFGAAFYLLAQAGDHQDLAKAEACRQQFYQLIGVEVPK